MTIFYVFRLPVLKYQLFIIYNAHDLFLIWLRNQSYSLESIWDIECNVEDKRFSINAHFSQKTSHFVALKTKILCSFLSSRYYICTKPYLKAPHIWVNPSSETLWICLEHSAILEHRVYQAHRIRSILFSSYQ